MKCYVYIRKELNAGCFSPHVLPDLSRYLQSVVAMQSEVSLVRSWQRIVAVFTDCAGESAECIAACVCVREHLRSEVKPRRPTSCTESIHGGWETSRLIAFRCDQDCSRLTCNETVQETCKAQLQCSLKVLLARTAAVLEATTEIISTLRYSIRKDARIRLRRPCV